MRYREGSLPGELGEPVPGDGMLIGTAVFGLLTGIGFVIAGVYGRQRWLTVWGGGLVLSSVTYLCTFVVG